MDCWCVRVLMSARNIFIPRHGHGHGPHHCLFICWLKTAATTNIEHLSCLHLYLPTPRIAKYNLSQRRILPHVNLIFPGKQNQMIWRDMLCGNSSNNVTCLFRHRVLFTGLGFAMFLDQKNHQGAGSLSFFLQNRAAINTRQISRFSPVRPSPVRPSLVWP